MGSGNLQMSSNSQSFYNVPKLASNGSNWITYKTRHKNSIKAWGLVQHLNGTTIQGADPSPLSKDHVHILCEILKHNNLDQKIAKFKQNKASTKQQIFSTISDFLLLWLQSENLNTTKEIWNAISKEFQ